MDGLLGSCDRPEDQAYVGSEKQKLSKSFFIEA